MRAGVVVGLTVVASATASAENVRNFSGAQIRARLIGMQLTDEVHYRFVYERDGTLRSYSRVRRRSENGPLGRTSCVFGSEKMTTVATR